MTTVSPATLAVMETIQVREAQAREAKALEASQAREANKAKMDILTDLTQWLAQHKLGKWRQVRLYFTPPDTLLHVTLTYHQNGGWRIEGWEFDSCMEDYSNLFGGKSLSIGSDEAQIFLAKETTAVEVMDAWLAFALRKGLPVRIVTKV